MSHFSSNTHYRILDIGKALALNLIVLHHLAFYGAMPDNFTPLVPNLMPWLANEA